MSAKIGSAPVERIVFDDAMNEFVLVITLELFEIFAANKDRCNALLPEFTEIAFFVPF